MPFQLFGVLAGCYHVFFRSYLYSNLPPSFRSYLYSNLPPFLSVLRLSFEHLFALLHFLVMNVCCNLAQLFAICLCSLGFQQCFSSSLSSSYFSIHIWCQQIFAGMSIALDFHACCLEK